MFVGFKVSFGLVVIMAIIVLMLIRAAILAVFARGTKKEMKRKQAVALFYAAIGGVVGVILARILP